MKKIVSALLTLLIVIGFFAYSLWVERGNTKDADAVGLPLIVVNEFNATSTYCASDSNDDKCGYLTATSTFWLDLLAGSWDATEFGATQNKATATSKTLGINGVKNLSVYMFSVSTGTAPRLSVEADVSPDGNQFYPLILTKNGVNTSNATNFSDAFLLATSTLFSEDINSGGTDADSSTTTSMFSLDLSGISAKYMRLYFGSNSTSTLRTTYVLNPE